MQPETIDRYQIQRELGRGGMATVYLAYDPQQNQEVAIKVLPREFLHDPTFLKRFQREIDTLTTLVHPAIVGSYGSGEDKGQPWLAMPYMKGGTLADKLKQGPLSLKQIDEILNRIAPALDKAHQEGIIHRDVKPPNILFDGDGRAYLADFGLAKVTGVRRAINLDKAPFDWSIEESQELLDLLCKAYDKISSLKMLVATVPLDTSLLNVEQPLRIVWSNTIDLASKTGRLRTLMEKVLKDSSIAGFHDDFDELITPAAQSMTQNRLGTPAYMSPEQISGKKGSPIDRRSDLYSLGVVIFEMLTGRHPYYEYEGTGLLTAHLQVDVPDAIALRPDLPRRCNAFLQRAMAKKPEERFSTAQEMTQGFHKIATYKPYDKKVWLALGATVVGLPVLVMSIWLVVTIVGDSGKKPDPIGATLKTTEPNTLPDKPIDLGSKPPAEEPKITPTVTTPSEKPPPTKVKLSLTLTPKDAKVTLDGKELSPKDGKLKVDIDYSTTPTKLKIEAKCYNTQEIPLTPNKDFTKTVTLDSSATQNRFEKGLDGSGTVTDTKNCLIWTEKDNGADINWADATNYCKNKGMRLPSTRDLDELYTAGSAHISPCSLGSGSGIEIKHPKEISLSCTLQWSNKSSGAKADIKSFATKYGGVVGMGEQTMNTGLRALCVRDK